jgi:mRNA-degrading endonuclease toxin of MazEF toxin-antitoxin module
MGRGRAGHDGSRMGGPGVVGIGREAPVAGGHMLRGPHPAVVVQAERMRRSSTVIVVPMTSAARSATELPPYLVAVTGRESGLDRDGFVKADQPATLPVAALGPRAGRLAPAVIDRLDAALRFVLEL